MKAQRSADDVRTWLELFFWASRQMLFLILLAAAVAASIAALINGELAPDRLLSFRSVWLYP